MLLPTVKGRPVLLPSHDDRELGQPVKHYHVDPRFAKGNKPIIFADNGEEVVYQDFDLHEPKVEFGVGLYLQLLYFYEGKQLYKGKCPHKGVEVFYKGQCQGHGLRFKDCVVLGKIAECYLRIPGSNSISPRGNFDAIRIVETSLQVKAVELVYESMVLATSNAGPVSIKRGQYIKFSFAIGQDAQCPVQRSVSQSPIPANYANSGHHSHSERNQRTELSTYGPDTCPEGHDTGKCDDLPD